MEFGFGYYAIGFGNLDPIDFAILYDVIEYYERRYNLKATDAVRFYEKCRGQANKEAYYDERS